MKPTDRTGGERTAVILSVAAPRCGHDSSRTGPTEPAGKWPDHDPDALPKLAVKNG